MCVGALEQQAVLNLNCLSPPIWPEAMLLRTLVFIGCCAGRVAAAVCPGTGCPVLQEGIVALGDVDGGQLALFSFLPQSVGSASRVRLTQIGSASITAYVSTTGMPPTISATHVVAGAAYTSAWDSVPLAVPGSQSTNPLYIAVTLSDLTSSSSARFSIVVTSGDTDVLTLVEGVPQFDSGTPSAMQYFRAEIVHTPTVDGTIPARDLTIAVTAMEGDPDVYANQFRRVLPVVPTAAPSASSSQSPGCGHISEFGSTTKFIGLSTSSHFNWPTSPTSSRYGYYTYMSLDSTMAFRKVPALRESAVGAVSFQTCHAGYETMYLKRIGGRIKLARNDGSDSFAGDASFYERSDPFSQSATSVSYEVVSKPGYYMRRRSSVFSSTTRIYSSHISATSATSTKTGAGWAFDLINPNLPTLAPTMPPTMPLINPTSSDWPTTSVSQYFAYDVGSDVVVIGTQSAHSCAPDPTSGTVCEILIGVKSYTASRYTVLLSFSSSWRYATNLIDGVPQTAAVASHQYTYFVFGFEEEKAGGEVEISLNPHTAGADHDLFVCAGSCSNDEDHSDAPSREHYDYRSIAASGEDYVRVETKYLVCGGANSSAGGDGSPTPSPTAGSNYGGLPCATPTAGISTPNDKTYYLLPDVSFGSRHAMVFTVKAGHDAHIGLFQADYCTTPGTGTGGAKKCSIPPRAYTMYEIIIGGWTNSLSVIRRSAQTNTKTHSRTRHPLSSSADKTFWISYDISTGLVSVGKGLIVGSSPMMSWTDPTPLQITKVGIMTGWGASGTWHVCTTTPPPPPVGWCLLNIAVYSYYAQGESLFTIAAATGAASVRLRDGVPQMRHIARSRTYEYFLLNIGTVHREVLISVTSLSALSCNIYVSAIDGSSTSAGKQKPTMSTNDWHSSSWSSQNSLLIKATDPKFCQNCDLWVGVYGRNAGDFSIVATMSQNSLTELIDGQLQSASVARDGWIYFYFVLGGEHTGLKINANVAVGGGDISIFVAEHVGLVPSPHELELPNATFFDFRSGFESSPSIVLPSADVAPGATYAVAVHGTSSIETAETIPFTISIATDAVDMPLTLGVVDGGHFVGAGAMSWYRAEAGRIDKDMFVSITPTEGIVDVVISTRTGRPTCTPWSFWGPSVVSSGHCSNFTWRFTADALNTSAYTGEMTIAHSDPCSTAWYPQYYHNCDAAAEFRDTFFIGVYGRTRSRFSILASLVGMTTTLLDSTPLVTRTSPLAVCARTDAGACSDDLIMLDGSYFTFSVTRDEDVQTVSISVEILNAEEAIKSSELTNLLSMSLYVRSCYSDTCTESARFPEPKYCKVAGNACSSPPPLVIKEPTSDATKTRLLFQLDESAAAWCPVSATKGACLYSVGIFSDLSCSGEEGHRDNGGVVFRVEYSSSAGMLVVPGETIYSRMQRLDRVALSSANPTKKFTVTPFSEITSIATGDYYVVRVESCAGTVGLYGCGNSGELAPASYKKVVNRVLSSGFVGYTKAELKLSTWPCTSGTTDTCASTLHSACLAKCEASVPACHSFSIEYRPFEEQAIGTPCRICTGGNGDMCPSHNFGWLGGTSSALYSTSGCKNPRSPSSSDHDFMERTPALNGGVDSILATSTILLEANGDDIVVVVDAFLDIPAGHTTPTFVMSVGGSPKNAPLKLLTEPIPPTGKVSSVMLSGAVQSTQVSLTWPLVSRCPISWDSFKAGKGATQCSGASAEFGGTYQVCVSALFRKHDFDLRCLTTPPPLSTFLFTPPSSCHCLTTTATTL